MHVLCKWQKRGQAFCLANSNPKNSKNASLGRVLPGGLPAARNRANGAARVPVDHGRPLGARACPPGTRGSTLSLGAAAGHRRRAFSARRGLDAPDRHPARERLAGVSRAGGERLLTGWDISAAGLAQSQPLVASSPLSPVVARAEMSTCSQLRGRGRTSQLLHRYRG